MAQAPKEIPVTIPAILGVPKQNILSFEIQNSQLGASFSFNFVLNPGEQTSIAENAYVSLIPNVFGYVDDVVYNISPSGGKTYSVSGRVFTPDMYKVKSSWYITDAEFSSVGNIPHVSQASDLGKTGAIRTVPNMNFLGLIQAICADNGIPYQVAGEVVNYKIYSYYLDATSDITQSLQGLALQAGCNLVVQNGTLVFIPWGSASGNYDLGEDSVTLDLKTSTDTLPFKDLILKGSDELTPWNGFYIGLPEKIASLNFEAGPISVKDISYGTGVVQPSKDWIFPEDGINNWQTFNITFGSSGTAANPVMNHISATLGVESVWDYKFLEPNAINYQAMFIDLKKISFKTDINPQQTSQEYKNGATATYKGLVSWKNAYTVVSNSSDIHPLLYVLPSDIAPDYPPFGLFNLQDEQQLLLSQTNQQTSISGSSDFYQEVSFINGISPPQEFGRITPDGYGIVAKDSNGSDGFNPDGSFVVSMNFPSSRSVKKKIESPGNMVRVYIQNGVYTSVFTSAALVKGKAEITVNFPNFADQNSKSPHLADHIRKVMQRTGATVIMPARPAGSTLIPIFGPSITPAESGYREETTTDQTAIDYENQYLNNTYNILDVSPVYGADQVIDPNQAIISVAPPCAITHTAPFTLFRKFNNHDFSIAISRKSTVGEFTAFSADSGLVAENSESIKAAWSIYGIRRKVFPVTVVNGRPYYFGLSDDIDAQNNAIIDAVKNKYTKNVSCPNITFNVGTNSDLVCLSTKILDYMFQSFSRTSRTFAAQNIEIPPVGAFCKDGIIVSSSVTISESGAFITVNCGALPII